MTPSHHAWTAAGCPSHLYSDEPCSGVCATCALPIGLGVPLAQIETPTTANHADYFRFGSKHVCPACAWLYGAGKGRPGNYLATPGVMEYTVISLESVVEDKRPWLTVLRELATMPAATACAAVMTTDVKPRLWPRARLSTVGNFGLYLHCPDYDVSEYRVFDLAECLEIVEAILPALTAGFAKASVWYGLARDFGRFSKSPETAMALEMALAPLRASPAFLPAIIAAGVTKEDKRDVKPIAPALPVAKPQSAPASRDTEPQTQLGLF